MLRQLSESTMAELQGMLRWWRQLSKGGKTGVQTGVAIPNERHIRWARTINLGTYPAGTKVIACELGEYTFDDSAVADVAATFTAYEPQEVRNVYFKFGWRPLGSIVRLSLHDGKWFCLDEASEIYGKIVEAGGIAADGSGDFDVWYEGDVTSPLQTITVHFDKMAAGTAAEDAMALVRFFPDEDHFSIVELECD